MARNWIVIENQQSSICYTYNLKAMVGWGWRFVWLWESRSPSDYEVTTLLSTKMPEQVAQLSCPNRVLGNVIFFAQHLRIVAKQNSTENFPIIFVFLASWCFFLHFGGFLHHMMPWRWTFSKHHLGYTKPNGKEVAHGWHNLTHDCWVFGIVYE